MKIKSAHLTSYQKLCPLIQQPTIGVCFSPCSEGVRKERDAFSPSLTQWKQYIEKYGMENVIKAPVLRRQVENGLLHPYFLIKDISKEFVRIPDLPFFILDVVGRIALQEKLAAASAVRKQLTRSHETLAKVTRAKKERIEGLETAKHFKLELCTAQDLFQLIYRHRPLLLGNTGPGLETLPAAAKTLAGDFENDAAVQALASYVQILTRKATGRRG